MKECRECGKQYEGNFCPYCGAKWLDEQASERLCPDCGATVSSDMRFCANCGYDFAGKKSAEEVKAEKRLQAALLRTANFMEAIPSMLRIGNAVFAAIFSVLLWVLFALPVTTLFEESMGNLYQFMSGTTVLGELLEPMSIIALVMLLALVAVIYALVALYACISDRKKEEAHTKHCVYNLVFLAFYILFFVVGCVVRATVSDYGLTPGACANALMICSAVFLGLSLALSIVSFVLTAKAKAPLTPEEKVAKDAKKAALVAKAKRFTKVTCSLAAVALVLGIIIGVSTNVFRAGKVSKIAIGASEATVLDVLGAPYSKDGDAEYTEANHDTVWKYYSKSYTKVHEKIAALEERSKNASSLGDLGGILEEALALGEEALSLRYKYIEVAFKDEAVVAVYLDKDKCDMDTEKKSAGVDKLAFHPFKYTGCEGGGYGKTYLQATYWDGCYAYDSFYVENNNWTLCWTDFKGEQTFYPSGSAWDGTQRSTYQHTADEWETTEEPTCTEDGSKYGDCIYGCGSVTETIPATGHTGTYVVTQSPTCTQTGTRVIDCDTCGTRYVKETIPAAGHKNQNGTCTVCSLVLSLGENTHIRVDAEGKKNAYGTCILFGEYPQSLKAEGVTVAATADSRGYYLGSDGFYYAKVTADPYSSGYQFGSGASVVDGTVYYFKVEPIRWRILAEDGDTALILCDSIIANKRFDDSSNNYKDSEIRAWLNNEFYRTAFNSLQKDLINTVLVDNSAAATGNSSNSYACEDTSDKVFLLSYKEVTSPAYGFSADYRDSDTARRKQVSDYARATGAYMVTSSSYYGNGYWWLRSPNHYDGSSARGVNYGGNIYDYNRSVYYVNSGVVPALQIRLR